MPAELIARRAELEAARAQLSDAERERVRQGALRSNRYLLHEFALRQNQCAKGARA
jgi:hypothetical protein